MVVAETDPIGGFIGESISLPAFQGGLLATYMVFIFLQDFWLGLAAIALYPPQVWLIPRLQKKINLLSKERVQQARALSDRIGETVSGAAEIRGNDTFHRERADISDRLGRSTRFASTSSSASSSSSSSTTSSPRSRRSSSIRWAAIW
jgi:ABC-type multidrug transport system fused ATPase/permease subunit